MIRTNRSLLSTAAVLSAPLLTAALWASAARAQDEYLLARMPDLSWVTVSGDVATAGPDGFLLDYGMGRIEVEMDDLDDAGEGEGISAGERVTVVGRIDAAFFSARTVEAAAVYSRDDGAVYLAGAADEEAGRARFLAAPELDYDDARITVTGVVQTVDGRTFTMMQGPDWRLPIDTSGLPDDPLDDQGSPRVRPGDVVQVTGEVRESLFRDMRVQAKTLVKLVR